MSCICRRITEPISFTVDSISHLDLPTALSWTVTCVHLCHFFGRAVSRLELREQHPGLYLAGALMNARYGDVGFLKATAQIVRVARVLFSTVEAGGELVHSFDRLREAFSCPKCNVLSYEGNRLTNPGWRGQEGQAPSFLFLPWPIALIVSTIAVVVMRIVEIASRIWKLNLCLFDLYDSIWMTPFEQSSAIEDLFIELGQIVDQFASPERKLAQAVAYHREWIDQLLHLIKIDWSAERIVSLLNSFADKTEGIVKACSGPIQGIADMAQGTAMVASALTIGDSSEASQPTPPDAQQIWRYSHETYSSAPCTSKSKPGNGT